MVSLGDEIKMRVRTVSCVQTTHRQKRAWSGVRVRQALCVQAGAWGWIQGPGGGPVQPEPGAAVGGGEGEVWTGSWRRCGSLFRDPGEGFRMGEGTLAVQAQGGLGYPQARDWTQNSVPQQ